MVCNIRSFKSPCHAAFGSAARSVRGTRLRLRVYLAYEEIVIPQSKELMVQQAGRALAERLKIGSIGNKKKKGFQRSAAGVKLAVELALADDSPESVTRVCQEFLQQQEKDIQAECVLAFSDIEAALLASERMDNDVCSVQDFAGANPAGVLLAIGTPSQQEGQAAELVQKWRGRAAVYLSLGTNSFLDSMSPARASLDTVYAYEPVAAKGLIRTTDGLILRAPLSGKVTPWLIYKRSWGEYKLIGKTSQRPTATDLEMALYNSSASESPIVRGIKAFRSATSKQAK